MQIKVHIWKWLMVWTILCCTGHLFSQTETEKSVMQLFDTPISWLKSYKGQIDNTHPVKLCLAFDGFNCRGYLDYDESDTRYLLEGSLQSSQLVFLEKYNNVPSGYLNGKFSAEEIDLEWVAIDESKAFEAHFTRVSALSNQAKELVTKGDDAQKRGWSFISHGTKINCSLPDYDSAFNKQIDELLSEWLKEIKSKSDNASAKRFGNTAEIWFDVVLSTDKYHAGILHYSRSWNGKLLSQSFTYDRKKQKLISVSSFMKASSKWETQIREEMKAKVDNATLVSADQKEYEKWIDTVSLIDPILSDDGIIFYTMSSAVFGNVALKKTWDKLSPEMISSAKLNKLKR